MRIIEPESGGEGRNQKYEAPHLKIERNKKTFFLRLRMKEGFCY